MTTGGKSIYVGLATALNYFVFSVTKGPYSSVLLDVYLRNIGCLVQKCVSRSFKVQ